MKKSTLYLFFSLFLITGCLKTKKASFDVSSPAGFFFFGGIVSAIAAANSTASFSIPDPNLTFSNVQNTSVTVTWKSASAVSGTITYKAYFSLISDMDTVANMESNGSFTQDYAASVNQMTFSGLIPNKYYYFNVAAQNSGTKLNYTKKCIQVYQDSTVTDCSFDPLSVKGTAATVIGTCGTTGTTNGSFSAAQFKDPLYMQTVGNNIFLTEAHMNSGSCAIRKLDMTNSLVTVYAGNIGSCSSYTDSTLTSSYFRSPHGITYDGTNLYVNDYFAHTVRKISSANVTTLAGTDLSNSYADGTGSAARFNNPIGMFYDGTSVFVGDYNNCRIRKINPSTGDVSTFAGKGCPPLADSDGIGTAAMLNGGAGSIDTDGKYFYVAEMGNHRIRKIDISTGNVSTLAGPSSCGTSACIAGSSDGTGSAASFNSPHSLLYINKYLFVMDYGSGNLRRINASTGETATVTNVSGIFNAFGLAFYNKKLYTSLRTHYCIKSVQ